MPDNDAPKPDFISTPKGSRFAPGHRQFPRRRTDIPPTRRQQRRLQAQALSRIILDMAARANAGELVNPNDFTRLIGLQMRLEREL